MGIARRIAGAAIPIGFAVLAASAAACHRSEVALEEEAGPPAPSATALDRLAPGELIEGDKKAFGITLPRDLKVDQAVTEVIFASGPMPASDLANYVRARVRDGAVSVGATATVFDRVTAPGAPARPLFIRVTEGPMGRGARMEVRDVTPPPQPNLATPEERWKKMGLTPEGKVLDPTHLE